MFRRVLAVIIIIVLTFTACVATAQISSSISVLDEALVFNEVLLQDMMKRDVNAVIEKSLDEVKSMEGFEDSLNKFIAYLPDHVPGQTYDALTREVRQTADALTPEPIYKTQYEITDLNLPDGINDEWGIVDIYSQDTDKGLKFRRFDFQSSTLQPSTLGNFDLKNKSIIHYVFLVLLIVVPIFIIVTIFAVIRNKHMTKKWLWGLFASFGVWDLSLNWITEQISSTFIQITSDSVSMNFISFHLLGAGLTKESTYSPYIITIALPLGAILYWVFKHKNKSVPQTFE